MEDIIAYFLIVALIVVPVFVVYGAVKFFKKRIEERKLEEARRKEELEQRRIAREEAWDRMHKGSTHVGSTKYDYVADQNRTTVTEKDTGRRVSYVHETNGSPDLLTTMIVADMLTNHKDSSAGTVKWKDDVPTVTETSSRSSSFGLDDDDSRRSVSSSFSSSDSSSSWSSSSSSSDSGPSSDW